MKPNPRMLQTFIAMVALGLSMLSAQAGVKMFRGMNDTVSFSGGIWNYNSTSQWMNVGSTTLVPWTDSGDIALIVNYTNAWASTTMTIDNSFGAVEASGIIITNGMGSWQYNYFTGAPLRIGTNGVTIYTDTSDTFVDFNCPVVLTGAQTWRSAKVRTIDVSGTVTLTNVLSSAAGVSTPITFDGFNRVDPSLKAMTSARTTFAFKNNNTYSGSTTIQGGAVLYLLFSTAFPSSKIDSASALILSGGGLAITGSGVTYTQKVSSLVIKAGENFIGGKNASAVFDCGTIVRDGLGGTMNFPVSWNGGISCYTTSINDDNGIVGGWAIQNDLGNGTGFAKIGADTGITSESGTQRATTDSWRANDHVRITGGGTRTVGDVSVRTIRYGVGVTNDLMTSTVTILSGGLANAYTGSKLTNGKLRSGLGTGELFVFTTGPFDITSRIEDNGTTPLTLVKAQSGTLTLSGELAYTGGTYLNGGTLSLLGSGAVLSNSVKQAGGTTLRLASGAGLVCKAGGRVLGGNLTLGGGTVLKLDIGAKDGGGADVVPLSLSNPYASLTVTASQANPAAIFVSVPTGVELMRRPYRLLDWKVGTTVSGLTANAFTLSLPYYAAGYLSVTSSGLDLVLTSVSKGTVIVVR